MVGKRTPLDLGEITKDIFIPDFKGVRFDLSQTAINSEDGLHKDIFAIEERKGWDKSIEARCDFTRRIRLTRRASVFFFSIWQKSIMGRTLTEIKADDDMVPFFAEESAALIQEVIGCHLDKNEWCVISTPKRRHLVKNFASRISSQIADILNINFYDDVCSCRTRQRVNAVFDVNIVPSQNNIICFDDFVTTGSTLQAMKEALIHKGKNIIFFAGINNKL